MSLAHTYIHTHLEHAHTHTHTHTRTHTHTYTHIHTHTHTHTHTHLEHTHTHAASASCERAMGEYLSAYSELEYTNAGEVMQNVGKLQQAQAKERSVGGQSWLEGFFGGWPRTEVDGLLGLGCRQNALVVIFSSPSSEILVHYKWKIEGAAFIGT